MTDIDKELWIEIEERRRAELEIIESAYDPSEVWIIPSLLLQDSDNNHDEDHFPLASCSPEIHRRLNFEHDRRSLPTIELILTMPHQNQYPVLETSVLSVEAKLLVDSPHTNSEDDTNLMKPLISNLIQTCRQTSEENPGCESVFTVLSKAEEWIQDEGHTLLMDSISSSSTTQQQQETTTKAATQPSPAQHTTTHSSTTKQEVPCTTSQQPQPQPQPLFLHVIGSHHLLNHAPDNLLAKGGTKYKLNGYYRFGTPGLAFCVSSVQEEEDDPHIQNFRDALEKKMPQKKFDIVLSRPFLLNKDDTTTNTTNTSSTLDGWTEATMDQLRSILTKDEFRNILNIQGGGGGGGDSSSSTNSVMKSGKKNHEMKKKKKTKAKK